jgi:hypothetical protein
MSRLLRESKKQYMSNLISNENNRHPLDETLFLSEAAERCDISRTRAREICRFQKGEAAMKSKDEFLYSHKCRCVICPKRRLAMLHDIVANANKK